MTGPDDDPAETGPPRVDAFTSVVDGHWTTVYRFLHRMTGDVHETEDLTQETFLKALGRLDTVRPGSSLRVWLLKIAANAYFDAHRRRRRVDVKALDHDPATTGPGPEYHLEIGEQAALLKAGLEGLPEMTRMVFHLRAAEDLSFREIADLVGTTEQAARWHMRQARVRLLAQLAEKP